MAEALFLVLKTDLEHFPVVNDVTAVLINADDGDTDDEIVAAAIDQCTAAYISGQVISSFREGYFDTVLNVLDMSGGPLALDTSAYIFGDSLTPHFVEGTPDEFPSWVTALAAPGSGDLPTVAIDFANDQYYIEGVGEVAIGDALLYISDETAFAPGAQPEGYLGPDGLQGGAGDVCLSVAAQAAAGLVGSFVLTLDKLVDEDFTLEVGLFTETFDEIVGWRVSNDGDTNVLTDISGDQDDQPLMDVSGITEGLVKMGGTYSLSEIAGSINGETAVPLDDIPAAYGDRFHTVFASGFGEWVTSLVIYPPQTDADLATLTTPPS